MLSGLKPTLRLKPRPHSSTSRRISLLVFQLVNAARGVASVVQIRLNFKLCSIWYLRGAVNLMVQISLLITRYSSISRHLGLNEDVLELDFRLIRYSVANGRVLEKRRTEDMGNVLSVYGVRSKEMLNQEAGVDGLEFGVLRDCGNSNTSSWQSGSRRGPRWR